MNPQPAPHPVAGSIHPLPHRRRDFVDEALSYLQEGNPHMANQRLESFKHQSAEVMLACAWLDAGYPMRAKKVLEHWTRKGAVQSERS